MADQDISLVLAYLPDKYRSAYAKGKLTDDDLISWGKQAGLIKDAAPATAASKADFSNVTSAADTVPQVSDRYKSLPYYAGRALDALDSVQALGEDTAESIKGGIKSSIGAGFFTPSDQPGIGDYLNDLQGATLGGPAGQMYAKEAPTESNAVRAGAADLYQRGQAQIEDATKKAVTRAPGKFIGETLTGVGSMPSIALGVAGGPTSAIPDADMYAQEYTKARLGGLDREEAHKEALARTAPMAAIGAIPAGDVFGRIPLVKKAVGDVLMNDAGKLAVRVGNDVAGEAAKMGSIDVSNLLSDKAFAELSGDEKHKEYSNANLPDDLVGVFNHIVGATAQGGIFGLARAPHEMFRIAAESGQLAGHAIHGQVSSELDIKAEREKLQKAKEDRARRGEQGELFGSADPNSPSYDDQHLARTRDLVDNAIGQVTKRHEVDAAYAQNARDKHVADLQQQLEDAQNHLDSLGEDATSQRARGGRFGLDTLGQGDNAAMVAAAGRVRALTEQLRQAQAGPAPAPEKPVPALFNPGVQQELPMPEPRLQPADEARLKAELENKRRADEARSVLADDEKGIQGKAKSALAAARRRHASLLAQAGRDIADPDQRLAYVQDGLAKWDETHTLDSYVATERAKRQKINPAKVQLPPVPERAAAEEGVDPNAPVEDNSPIRPDEQIKSREELLKSMGMAQSAGGEGGTASNLTTNDVFEHLGKKMGGRDAKVAMKLIGDKNLVIVNDASDIPNNAVKLGDTAGFYDGKRAYVVANQITDPHNITGELMSVAAHEIHHAANLSGKVTLSGFVGNTDTSRLRGKIEALADKGDKYAVAAREGAKASEKANPGSYDDELLAYFINGAREARGGLAASVMRDIVSAVRTKFGDKMDINTKDVAYLSDKLLKAAAYKGERLTADTNGLSMIIGEKAKGAKDVHYKYQSVDGNTKHVISDADSYLPAGTLDKLRKLGDMQDKRASLPLDNLLDHYELYKNYPDAGGVRVSVDNTLPAGHGFFDGKNITISGKGLHDGADVRKLLLHEVQHWVQQHEGHAGGSNSDMFKTAEDKEAISKHEAVKTKLDYNTSVLKKHEAMQDLAPEIDKSLTKREFLEMAAIRLRGTGKAIDKMQAENIDRLLASYENTKAEAGRAELRAQKSYHETLGEREARFTEQNADNLKPDFNPEKYGGFDSSLPADESIIVRDGKNYGTAKEYRAGREGVDAEGPAMSVDNRFNDRRAQQLADEEEALVKQIKSEQLRARVEKAHEGIKYELDTHIVPAEKLRAKLSKIDKASGAASLHLSDSYYWAVDRLNDLFKEFGHVDIDSMDHRQAAEHLEHMQGELDYFGARIYHSMLDSVNGLRQFEKNARSQSRYDRELKKAIQEHLGPADNVVPFKGGPGMAFNLSDFRNALKQVRESDSKPIRLLKSQLDYKGGLGKELNEMREASVGDAALYSHRGMNAFGRINNAVSTVATEAVGRGRFKTQAEAEASIKKDINDNLERIAALPDENRRASALSAWVRENPQYRPVADAVAEINQLSKTLLGQMLISHPNPTPAQLRLMNTIHDNMFRYATRMYAAFQGEAGREHSRHLIDRYNKAKEALAKGKNVPEKAREAFRIYTDAMKYLIDHDLTIPAEREGLEALSTDRLGQLFDTWVGNAKEAKQIARAEAEDQGLNKPGQDQFVREAMIEALERRRETVNQAQLEGKADDLIKGMLGLNESAQPFATFYRGFTQDRTILEHREHLPQEIRDLFGEIKDPAVRLAVTIAKQGELAARTRLLMDMKEHGLGKWVIPPEDAGLPGNEKFNVTLKGKNYGPLNGWRTTKTVSSAIGSNLELYSTLGDALAKSYANTDAALQALGRAGLQGVKTLAGWQKIASIVWDLYNIGNNFAGSATQLVANGVYNLKYYKGGLKVGVDVIADAIFDNAGRLNPEYEDAIKYGLLDSARVQEIRSTPQRVIRNMISDEARLAQAAKSTGRRAVRGLVETFAMSDAWTKVSAWQQRIDHLTKFYKAEGIEKSEDEIKREAADQMKDTNITYSRVPPGIRTLESVGLTTFMPYFYSVPRVIVNNYHLGVRDLVQAAHATSDKGKMMMLQSGVGRIAGATASTYGLTILLKSIAAAVNGHDKDKDEEMKKLMNQDARFADSIYLGKDAAGIPLFFRLSRVDPFGPVNDVMRVYMKDDLTPAEKSKYALNLLSGLVFSNRVTQALIKAGASALPNTDVQVASRSRVERLFPNSAEKVKDALTSLPHVDLQDAKNVLAFTDSLLPGIIDAVDPTNTVPKEVKGNDPWLKFLGQMAVASGGRLDRADPNMAAYVASKGVEQARKDGRQRMADGFNAGSSASDLMSRYMDAANQEYNAMQEVNNVYEGMTRGLGMTPRQASEVLKDGTKLTAADIHGLRTGRINQESEEWIKKSSGILSESSLKQRDESNQRTLSPQEKKERDKAIKQFLDNMRAMGLKVQKEGKH